MSGQRMCYGGPRGRCRRIAAWNVSYFQDGSGSLDACHVHGTHAARAIDKDHGHGRALTFWPLFTR